MDNADIGLLLAIVVIVTRIIRAKLALDGEAVALVAIMTGMIVMGVYDTLPLDVIDTLRDGLLVGFMAIGGYAAFQSVNRSQQEQRQEQHSERAPLAERDDESPPVTTEWSYTSTHDQTMRLPAARVREGN